MIYPSNFEEKTGFDLVKKQIADYCLSESGRQRVTSLQFHTAPDVIRRLLRETSEFVRIIESGLPFPQDDYYDLSPVLTRIQSPGSWLLPGELHLLLLSLMTIEECLSFFRLPLAADFLQLKLLAGDIELPAEIIKAAGRIIDEKGDIRDGASPELASLRKEIRQKTIASEKLLGRLLEQARNSGWVAQDAGITLNEGRLVLPLSATHKRKIRGIIHDESASGQTVYLEPEEVLELNNEIRVLESEERREIIRILTRFSDLLREHKTLLDQAYDFLGEIDFTRAKARYAIDTEGHEPRIAEHPVMNWRNARHPLLELSLRSKDKSIVPLNISLDHTDRVLVITGPNAGGKSVCLKTAGLLQYMLQCGTLPPFDADSEACIFRQIFIDIGDEQSLENDLSTYSSHLINLKLFIENCNPSTLFLIDELGTGTDPALGGAIAEAGLSELSKTGAFGIVTTHYSNLKLLEGKIPGIVNGAMLFDTKKLKPLYQLSIGKPGSSFTFEIARRLGFPEHLIDAASEIAGKTHIDFEQKLQELETEKLELERKLSEFKVADGFLGELIEKYEALKTEVETSRKMVLEKARQEARDLLDQTNRVIEKTIKDIRESQAEKTATKSARSGIDEFRKKLANIATTVKQAGENKQAAPAQPSLRPGSWVAIEGKGKPGRIERIKGSKATVEFDGVKATIPLSRLTAAEPIKSAITPKTRKIMEDVNEKAMNFKLSLDLRGSTADEALQLVQKYLDDAYLLRIKEVSILHGKGEGILRRVIREYLSHCEEVASYGDEEIERGGAGITRVVIR